MEAITNALHQLSKIDHIKRDDATPKCEGFGFYDGKKCASILTLVPCWTFVWNWLTGVCIFTFTILFMMLLNRIAGIHMKYRKNPANEMYTLRNLMTWSCIVGVIGCILMGVAYIDGWAFAGRLRVTDYLGVYPVAYSFIPLSVVFLQLHFLDKLYLAYFNGFGIVKKTYAIGTLVAASLFACYAGPGFIGFGQRLRVEFLKDPNTPLGIAGNHVIGALYSGVIILCVAAMGPVIWKSYKQMGDEPKFIKSTGALVMWTLATMIIAGTNICNIYLWSYVKQTVNEVSPYATDEILPLLSTMKMLEWNRILEFMFIINNLVLMGNGWPEVFPLENLVLVWKSNGRDVSAGNHRGAGTSRTRITTGKESSGSKEMSSVTSPRRSKNSSKSDTIDNTVTNDV